MYRLGDPVEGLDVDTVPKTTFKPYKRAWLKLMKLENRTFWLDARLMDLFSLSDKGNTTPGNRVTFTEQLKSSGQSFRKD